MLARVKVEMIRLLDEYILGDLGFEERHLKIVFSGGRGYHAHITDPRALILRSHERREIVDYIIGTDLSIDWLLPEETRVGIRTPTGTRALGRRNLPPPNAGGWRGKLRPGLKSLLDEMEVLGPTLARERYASLRGLKEEAVTSLFEDLFLGKPGRRGRDLILEKGNLANVRDRNLDVFIALLQGELKPRLAGEVDEPVTSDIKRLIRMPYSLHGKTGLRVLPMKRSELDDFDPLRDAVPDVLSDEPVSLRMSKRVDLRLRNERFVLEGDVEVPEFAALFLICRREATLR
jgi:DNA primase small subunit